MFTALCHNASGLLANRFFLGIAEAAMAPGLSMIIAMWYKRSEQPLRQGAWFLGNTTAGLLGGLVSYGLGHIRSIAPWKVGNASITRTCRNILLTTRQVIFLVYGAATLVVAVVVFVFLPDTPLNARFLSKDERAQAVARVEANMTGIKNNKWKREQAIEALRDPNAWLLAITYLTTIIPNNGLLTASALYSFHLNKI